MVENSVLATEVLEGFRFIRAKIEGTFWVNHRCDHIVVLGQRERRQAFCHKVEAVNLVLFSVNYLTLSKDHRFQVTLDPVDEIPVSDFQEKREVFKRFIVHGHHQLQPKVEWQRC